MRRWPEDHLGNIWPINNDNTMIKHIISLTVGLGTLFLVSCGTTSTSGNMQEPMAQAATERQRTRPLKVWP